MGTYDCKQNLMVSFSHTQGARKPAIELEETLIYDKGFITLTNRSDFKTYVYRPPTL